MQAIILIGGLGTRLYPLTYTTPKSLLPIANIPFLSALLHWLKRNGVSEVIFAVSHLAPTVINFLKTHHSDLGIPLVIRMETEPLGSGGALKNCEDLIKGQFILFNGDILTDIDLRALMSFHESSKAVVTTTLSHVEDVAHYGIVDVDAAGRAHGWQEKPKREEAKSHWGNVGAWAMSPDVLRFIPPRRFVSLEKETFPMLFKEGVPFFGYRFAGYWKDIGNIERYVQANRDLLNGKIGGTPIPGREIKKGIWVDASAALADDVKFYPPAVVGRNCRIAGDVEISGPTAIGDNCEIESAAKIASSILWPATKIGQGTRISNSVVASARIGSECVVGDGSVICSDTTVGPGAILPPGTIIGPGSSLRWNSGTR